MIDSIDSYITNSTSSVAVNQLGFITRYSNINVINDSFPAYFVIFQDYSRVNPLCEELDISQTLNELILYNDSIKCTKNIGDFLIESKIELLESSLDWTVTVLNEDIPRHYRFGVAIPCPNDNIMSMNHEIKCPLVKYNTVFEEIFIDQMELEWPILSLMGQNNCVSIFASWKDNVQFFINKSPVTYVRVTALTTFSKVLKIRLSIHRKEDDILSLYLSKHPDAKHLLEKQPDKLLDLCRIYNIKIKYKLDEKNEFYLLNGRILCKNPTIKQINRWNINIIKEIKKYPTNIFKYLDIRGIYLCRDIEWQDYRTIEQLNGLCKIGSEATNWIILDSSGSEKTLHHEIYHAIKINLINKKPDHHDEECADLFADMLTQPSAIESKILFNQDIKNKVHIIEQDVRMIIPDFEWKITETTAVEKYIYFRQQDGSITKIIFGEFPPKLSDSHKIVKFEFLL